MENLGQGILNYQPSDSESTGTPFHHIITESAKNNLTIDRKPVDEIIKGSYFVIPDYQRGFQWGENEFEDLWEDLEELIQRDFGEDQSKVRDVFFGSMFFAKTDEYKNESSKDTYEVIDGQQRLTTTFMLLKQIQKYLDEYDIDFEDAPITSNGLNSEKVNIGGVLSLYSGAGTSNKP